MDRRQFTLATTALLGAPALLAGCDAGRTAHEAAAAATWRLGTLPPGDGTVLRTELVRYATLAPSSHNTQ